MFIEWLYHGCIAVQDELKEEEEPEVDMDDLVKAYVLGLELLSSRFCQDVIVGLLEISDEFRVYPGAPGLRLTYNKTAKGSILRLLLVELYAREAEGDWFDDEEGEDNTYPGEFFKDLTIALLEKRPEDATWDLAEMKAKYVTEQATAQE
jgi:hypothetical protein